MQSNPRYEVILYRPCHTMRVYAETNDRSEAMWKAHVATDYVHGEGRYVALVHDRQAPQDGPIYRAESQDEADGYDASDDELEANHEAAEEHRHQAIMSLHRLYATVSSPC